MATISEEYKNNKALARQEEVSEQPLIAQSDQINQPDKQQNQTLQNETSKDGISIADQVAEYLNPDTNMQEMANQAGQQSFMDLYNQYIKKPSGLDEKTLKSRQALAGFTDIALLLGDIATAASGGLVNKRNKTNTGISNVFLQQELERIRGLQDAYSKGQYNAAVADKKSGDAVAAARAKAVQAAEAERRKFLYNWALMKGKGDIQKGIQLIKQEWQSGKNEKDRDLKNKITDKNNAASMNRLRYKTEQANKTSGNKKSKTGYIDLIVNGNKYSIPKESLNSVTMDLYEFWRKRGKLDEKDLLKAGDGYATNSTQWTAWLHDQIANNPQLAEEVIKRYAEPVNDTDYDWDGGFNRDSDNKGKNLGFKKQ